MLKKVLDYLKLEYKKQNQFKVEDQIRFVELYESLIASGRISQKEALNSIKEAYIDNFGAGHIVIDICNELSLSISTGNNSNEVMQKYFTPNLAIAYELTGIVTDKKKVVSDVVELVKLENTMKKDILTKLAVPAFMTVGGLTFLVVGGMIIPGLEEKKVVVESIFRTITLGVSFFFTHLWPVLLVLITCLIFGYKWFVNNYVGRYRKYADNYWPISNFKLVWGLRVLKLVGMLKKANLKDSEAVEVLHGYSPAYVRKELELIKSNSGKGESKVNFAHGLLGAMQKIRLKSYEGLSDSEFADGLIRTSENGIIDAQLYNQRILKRYEVFLYVFGSGSALIALNAVLDAVFAKSL